MQYTLQQKGTHEGQTTYLYEGEDGSRVCFYADKTVPFHYVFLPVDTPKPVTLALKLGISSAFILSGMRQHELGGFDAAIQTLEV
jgi:hypothetical protein